MKLLVEKEVKELYYLATRGWGNIKHSKIKTFVRTPYIKKDGSLGSCMYCSADHTAVMFDSYSNAVKLMDKYNCNGEEVRLFKFNKYLENGKLKIRGKEIALKEIEIEGIKCYQIAEK